jgi:hypothetical protein
LNQKNIEEKTFISIPGTTHKFALRHYQIPFVQALEQGYKRFDLVWHRRAGKDLTILNATVAAMLQVDNQGNPLVNYAGVGSYYYFFPTFAQGRRVLWDGMTRDGVRFLDYIPEAIRLQTWNDDMKIRLRNGSLFQVIGTDNYDCYDDQTDILTKDGWKRFRDISDNEIVATLKNGNIIYDKIIAKVEYDYQGTMYRVKSKSIDMLTTPNHKYFVESRKGFAKFREIQNINIFNDRIPATSKWKGKKQETYTLGKLTFNMSDWCAFIGIYLSEGSFLKVKKGYRVYITQDNLSHHDIVVDIKSLLWRMGLYFRYDGHNFLIENKELFEYVKRFGKCDEKYIPRDLLELSPKYLKILKDWLIKGDGYIQKGGYEHYYSTSLRLINDVQELIIKLGLSGNIKIKLQNGGTIRGRKIYPKKEMYEIFIRKSKYKYFGKTGQSYIYKEPYCGKIYCVEVPSHVIKVRRNGHELWCGNSIMGTNPIWCVFSEFALQDPKAWEFVRPILKENGGIAIFCYTPRGRNHAYDLHYNVALKNPDSWYSQTLSVYDTGVLTKEEVEQEIREGMSEELAAQEYLVSFEMGIEGSYYGRYVQIVRDEGRIKESLPVDSAKPVHTAWDIGVTDFTSIIFYQVFPHGYHIIDFYENSGEGVQHYAKMLQDKGYTYGNHYGPHDLAAKNWVSEGEPTIQVARRYGIHFQLVPRLSREDGIEAGRNVLSRCYFDESRTRILIDHLENYTKVFNKQMNCYTNTPKHDIHSHSADAWRYFAIAEKNPEVSDQNIPKKIHEYNDFLQKHTNKYTAL